MPILRHLHRWDRLFGSCLMSITYLKFITRSRASGKTTIAPGVLLTIARLTTLSVEGVSRLSNVPSGVKRLSGNNAQSTLADKTNMVAKLRIV